MSKVFEDEFMEIQSGLISLCMEVLEGKKVSKVYAYCSNEKKSKMFNAFFEADGEIKTLGKMGVPSGLVFKFLEIGTEDLEKLDSVCAKYSMPIPTEMKMYYDVETGKYNAKYKYETVCSAVETGKIAEDVFMEWVEEIKGQQ